MLARLLPRLALFPALAVSLCLLSLPPVLHIIRLRVVWACGWHAAVTPRARALEGMVGGCWFAWPFPLFSTVPVVVVEVWGAALHLAAPPPTPLFPLLLYLPWCDMRALPLWWCCGGGCGVGLARLLADAVRVASLLVPF